MRQILLYLLKFYQKYLTLLSFGSCRYYPTCSHYAQIQFTHNNLLKAFYYSTKRILSCNQLFRGGIDHPTIKYNLNNVVFKQIRVKYWFIPTKDNKFIIIKNWDRNIK